MHRGPDVPGTPKRVAVAQDHDAQRLRQVGLHAGVHAGEPTKSRAMRGKGGRCEAVLMCTPSPGAYWTRACPTPGLSRRIPRHLGPCRKLEAQRTRQPPGSQFSAASSTFSTLQKPAGRGTKSINIINRVRAKIGPAGDEKWADAPFCSSSRRRCCAQLPILGGLKQ